MPCRPPFPCLNNLPRPHATSDQCPRGPALEEPWDKAAGVCIGPMVSLPRLTYGPWQPVCMPRLAWHRPALRSLAVLATTVLCSFTCSCVLRLKRGRDGQWEQQAGGQQVRGHATAVPLAGRQQSHVGRLSRQGSGKDERTRQKRAVQRMPHKPWQAWWASVEACRGAHRRMRLLGQGEGAWHGVCISAAEWYRARQKPAR